MDNDQNLPESIENIENDIKDSENEENIKLPISENSKVGGNLPEPPNH